MVGSDLGFSFLYSTGMVPKFHWFIKEWWAKVMVRVNCGVPT